MQLLTLLFSLETGLDEQRTLEGHLERVTWFKPGSQMKFFCPPLSTTGARSGDCPGAYGHVTVGQSPQSSSLPFTDH